jgi:hypothetical protein
MNADDDNDFLIDIIVTDGGDNSPLQMISKNRLEHLQKLEEAVIDLFTATNKEQYKAAKELILNLITDVSTLKNLH